MKEYLVVCLWSLICLKANAQSVSTLVGARCAGMGNIGSVLSDASSLFNNIGSLSSVTDKSFFSTYEVPMQMPGANRTAFGILLPIKSSTVGLGLFRFGDDLYNEQVASIGWSQKLGSTSLGVRLSHVQYQAQGFGTKTGAGISLGGLTQITKQIFIGAYMMNLPIQNPTDEERLPALLVAGVGFKSGDVFIASEVEKNIHYAATWRMGVEYSIRQKVFIRTGFNLNPNAGFFGIGTQWKSLRIDYAVKINTYLGTAHQGSCTYGFRNRNKQK